MVSYEILDIKPFTKALFDGNLFDEFLMTEARIDTYNTFSIDGKTKKGYYTQGEEESFGIGEYSKWEKIRPVFFLLIKGKRLPLSFHIVLKLSEEEKRKWFMEKELCDPNISGLYLNIRYDERRLCCVSACSLSGFSMDQGAQRAWDEHIKEFLRKNQIAVRV
ncbi:MAG: DUF5721 family protein [Johnsonella sp.]|nr:DUF5721 family protein [Johnsonella sp.]